MQFLKNILSTVIGIFIFCLLSFFLLILIGIAAAASGGNEDVVTVKDNSVIELNIEDVHNDYAGKFYNDKLSFLNDTPHDGLINILNAIESAKTDDKIKGITITNSAVGLGIAQNKALRDKLEDFKSSGKFIVAYSDNFSQSDYYLNSVADTIYMNPVADLDFKGLSSEIMFYKDFQEKTGIKMEVIRHGKYKSAVEPFLSNSMSDANREQISELLGSVWESVVNDISKSRNIPVDSLNSIANKLAARTAEMAKNTKLIDKVGYEDQYHDGIRHALKVAKNEKYNSVDIVDYAEANSISDLLNSAEDEIAVVYAQGEIRSGEGSLDIIGEGAMRKALKEARENDNVKAVVLRVNSPGGSALTSELIWREVELTKQVKPVVVSMSNYAASGGYYISCGANRIFAEPGTITGSIGVFGMLPNVSQLANNMGIHTEKVSTHDNASGYSLFTPLEDDTRAIITEGVENIYNTFVNRVATGRNMTFEQVDSIAQGRVWSGKDALNNGLVDEIGGLDAAIAYAAQLGETQSYKTVNYPEYEMTFDKFLASKSGLPFAQSKEDLIKEEIGEENYIMLQRIRRINQLRGNQVILPYEITIR